MTRLVVVKVVGLSKRVLGDCVPSVEARLTMGKAYAKDETAEDR